ncbi:MAG: hypothetical protein Q9214_003687 [Letrouitia sp. 1 TL-2023]
MSQLPNRKPAIPPRTSEPSPVPGQLFSAAYHPAAYHPQQPAQASLIRESATSNPPFPRTFSHVLTQLARYQDLVNNTMRDLTKLQQHIQQAVGLERNMTQPDMGERGQASEARMEAPKAKELMIERALDMVFAYPVQLALDLLEKMTPEQRGEVSEGISGFGRFDLAEQEKEGKIYRGW